MQESAKIIMLFGLILLASNKCYRSVYLTVVFTCDGL